MKNAKPYNWEYHNFVKKLVSMDEKQLTELYHDMLIFGKLPDVERIADTANHFVENYEPNECESVDQCSCEKSDEQDWKEQDDAQRYRDIKSTQDSYR